MDPKFWHDKWKSNQIGFHEDRFHPMLCEFWDSLGIDTSAAVLVPLCGKSRDLVWLGERGHEVIGVELSEIAVRAFFDENAVAAEVDELGSFKRYRGGGYTLLCGDFFDLTPGELEPFTAVYDRAALIALPPDTRRGYVRHLAKLCIPEIVLFLITVGYPPTAVSPPPFLVSAEEVETLYSGWRQISVLAKGETSIKGVPGSQTAFCMRPL